MKKVVLAILIVLVAAGVAGFAYLKTEKGLVLDSAQVETQAAAMWPGAKPPSGLKGVLALRPEEDIQVAIFAPSLDKVKPGNLAGDDLRIVVAKPKIEGQPNIDEIKTKIAKARQQKDEEMETEKEDVALLKVGGQPYPGIQSDVVHRDSGTKLHEEVTILIKDKKPTVILILGPRDTYNTAARDEFLAALEAPENASGLPDKFQKPEMPAKPDMSAKPKIPIRPGRPGPRSGRTPGLPKPPGF